MKVLFPVDTATRRPTNPYLIQLIESLYKQSTVSEVAFGSEILHWNSSKWDVLHFQWPEAYFSWIKPDAKEFARAEARLLDHKRRGGVVVTTVHNHHPKPDFDEMGEKVFDLIYSNTDCFVHLGNASFSAFKDTFQAKEWLIGSRHRIIYHGDYSHYSKGAQDTYYAEQFSKYSGSKVLVFGALRTEDEELLAREAFKASALGADSVLIFAGSPSRSVIPKDILLGKHDKGFGKIVRFHRRIADEQIKSIFEAVDVVFIPRSGRLNSGVIPLAFSFNKLVVAPEEGVMGEMISNGRGISYTAGDACSAGRALSEAMSMSEQERGRILKSVRKFKEREMTWSSQANQHLSMYSELVGFSHPASARAAQAKTYQSDQDGSNMNEKKVCFSIALNGYDQRFGPCIDTHQRYCLRHGYKYWCLKTLPWRMTPKQCAWLKVELMRGLLSAGFDMCGFLDADCEFRPHTPAIDDKFSASSPFLMARGKSGRVNSGIMFARNEGEVLKFLELLISKCDEPVPKEDQTAYENGHFIHYGRRVDFIGELDHIKWNNNTKLEGMSFVQHYSGGDLRRWWEANVQPNLVTSEDIEIEQQGKIDVTNMAISEFLSKAREYFDPIYSQLYQSHRKLVV